MIYSSDYHIKSLEEVIFFFHHLVFDLKLNFHPDDLFEELVGENDSFFTKEKIEKYNSLMNECFCICEKEDVDIYGLGLPILKSGIEGKEYDFNISTQAIIKCVISTESNLLTKEQICSKINENFFYTKLNKGQVTLAKIDSIISKFSHDFQEKDGFIYLK